MAGYPQTTPCERPRGRRERVIHNQQNLDEIAAYIRDNPARQAARRNGGAL